MKEWLYRALRTFGQAMAGYLAANLLAVLADIDAGDETALTPALLGVFASSVAAGIAAVMNREKKENEPLDES